MYAKLLHYVLLSRTFSWSGIEPNAEAWNADVNWVNLDDANLSWVSLANPIDSGHIVLVETFDWTNYGPLASQLLYLLSSDGHRLTIPADTHGPISRYCKWPKISVTVLIHGAAPAAPPAAILPATTVFNFAKQLAANRNEQDQLLRGLYCAVELMGANLRTTAESVDVKHTMSVFMGQTSHALPMPRDYNYLARFLNLRPAPPPNHVADELEAFASRSNLETVTAMAIYAAANQSMTTTYLAGLNITTQQLIHYATTPAAFNNPSLLNILDVLTEPGITPSITNSDCDATLHVKVRRLVSHLFNMNIYDNLWWGGHAFLRRASVSAVVAAHIYGGMLTQHAPRIGTMFALTSLLKEYPYEWGASARGAHFNIQNEVVRRGPVADRGWRSVLGDQQYDKLVTLNSPFLLKMYGWQVMQCLLNRAELAAEPPHVQLMTHVWQQGLALTPWTMHQPIANIGPVYNAEAACYEPCTFVSYQWSTETVIAPQLLLTDVWWTYYSYYDGARATCGFDCLSADPGHVANPIEGIMDLSFLGLNMQSGFNQQAPGNLPLTGQPDTANTVNLN